jgi:hypothetical protein
VWFGVEEEIAEEKDEEITLVLKNRHITRYLRRVSLLLHHQHQLDVRVFFHQYQSESIYLLSSSLPIGTCTLPGKFGNQLVRKGVCHTFTTLTRTPGTITSVTARIQGYF